MKRFCPIWRNGACPIGFMIAPEQKARVTYDNILRLSDDPDVNDAIKFLRARGEVTVVEQTLDLIHV